MNRCMLLRVTGIALLALAIGDPALAQTLSAEQALGQRLYSQSCGVCHIRGQVGGNLYGPVLSQTSLSGDAGALRTVISEGVPRMPGFKHSLKPAEIDAIIAYLKTVAPPPPPAASAK